jgi:DDE superfamily endonuclease
MHLAILSADAAVPSPVHLSLQASHRRGWGSLYAALGRGRIDAESLRRLLARHPLAESQTPVYAVDVSVWDRCDAECSPLVKVSTTIHLATRRASPS